MDLSRTHWKQLASLSAAGIGAIAATAPNADASIITVNVNQTLTITVPGEHDVTLPGGDVIKLLQVQSGGRYLVGFGAGAGVSIGQGSGTGTSPLIAGKTWNQAHTHGGGEFSLGSYFSGIVVPRIGSPNNYFLFKFQNGPSTEYGWAQFSFTANGRNSTGTWINYAYDNTGAKIATGDSGPAPTPEPAGTALGGLARVMGAAAVRRWKKRNAA